MVELNYDLPLFRPPSEAFSLILQVTIGCSHNACAFCGMYKTKKFRVKDWKELESDIVLAAREMRQARRIFLADGNALAMPTASMLLLLGRLYRAFPMLERVAAYAGPRDILEKSDRELQEIRQAGLEILYLGVESGNGEILHQMHKGVTPSEMIAAGQKAIQAGFKLSVTVINGLGGRNLMREHALDTARLLSQIDPHYLGLLTLMPVPGTVLAMRIARGEFILPGPWEILTEIKLMLEHMQLSNCVFRCNHASNYLPLKGTLSRDQQALVALLDEALQNPDRYRLKPDFLRGL